MVCCVVIAAALVLGRDGSDAGQAGGREGHAELAAMAGAQGAVGEVDFESGERKFHLALRVVE